MINADKAGFTETGLEVTGDGDLLTLAAPGTRPLLRCRVITVQAFLEQLFPASPK